MSRPATIRSLADRVRRLALDLGEIDHQRAIRASSSMLDLARVRAELRTVEKSAAKAPAWTWQPLARTTAPRVSS